MPSELILNWLNENWELYKATKDSNFCVHKYQYENYEEIKDSIYVAICSFECDTKNPKPKDLRIMGEVAKCEYDCCAIYIELNGRYPKFNDMSNAPKYSKTKR